MLAKLDAGIDDFADVRDESCNSSVNISLSSFLVGDVAVKNLHLLKQKDRMMLGPQSL